VFTDGASRGNPGIAGIGIVLKKNEKVIIAKGYKLGVATNNVAEYMALLFALYLVKLEITESSFSILKICADSELLIKQLRGEYKVKNAALAKIHAAIKKKLHEIGKPHTFCHVRRELNSAADKMANKGIDENIALPNWIEENFYL
jgi:ribonuclease HI